MIKLLKNHPTGPNTLFIPFLLLILISIIVGLITYTTNDINMLKIFKTFLIITVIISFYISYKQTNIKDTDFTTTISDNKIIIKSKSDWIKSDSFEIFKEDNTNVYILDHNKIYTIRKNEINLNN